MDLFTTQGVTMAAKTTALKEAMSKTQLISELADSAGIGKKEVS